MVGATRKKRERDKESRPSKCRNKDSPLRLRLKVAGFLIYGNFKLQPHSRLRALAFPLRMSYVIFLDKIFFSSFMVENSIVGASFLSMHDEQSVTSPNNSTR